MFGRSVAIVAMLFGVAGLAIDFLAMMPVMSVSATNPVARSFPDFLVYYWTYFTHLTNLGLVLTYAAYLSGARWLSWFNRPATRAAMAAYIALVTAFFHFMLAPLYDFEGLLAIANVILHYVCPILYLGWWLAFAPHGTLRYRDIPLMLVPGLVYVIWVLVRGLWAHEYPYLILDAGKSGYGGVAIGVGIILVAVAVFSTALVFLDGVFADRGRAA